MKIEKMRKTLYELERKRLEEIYSPKSVAWRVMRDEYVEGMGCALEALAHFKAKLDLMTDKQVVTAYKMMIK